MTSNLNNTTSVRIAAPTGQTNSNNINENISINLPPIVSATLCQDVNGNQIIENINCTLPIITAGVLL